MALITCPECKKEISNTATECIHCGYSIINEDEQKKEWGGIEGFFSTLFILSLGIASISITPSEGSSGAGITFAFVFLILSVLFLVIIKQKKTSLALKTLNWLLWVLFTKMILDSFLRHFFDIKILSFSTYM
jgi:hypothetical protein